ncbi:hypothetical protein BGX31_008754 [Mortierella sp. GBA43]|nr:hypothetical protein BGX31_008754 [Mortierella sp. GBA43]
MADLGLYFGEEDEDQLTQEDKALSYLVLSSEQDDAFDPVDTENLLAQLSAGSLITHNMELDEDTDVVQLLAEPNLSAVEKAQLLSQSQYDYHRSFLARELPTILFQMRASRAISHIIPIIRDFSLDGMDPVRESLVSQLDKIVLYFYRNSVIVHDTKERTIMDDYSEDDDDNDLQDDQYPGSPPPLLHDVFTPIFMNLLLDQNAGIANQARLAIDAIAQNVPDEIMESEILNGLITRLEKLYTLEKHEQDEDILFSSSNDQDGEPELGKMLVVVILTALAPLLGPERCTQIIVPRLEQFTHNSQFYVRKEIVMALGSLSKIVEQDVVVSRLLPLYDTFVQDDTWHIRRACCTILASLIASLPVDMKATKAEEIYNIFSTDASRSVRNSIMEVLGEVIVVFERENVPESLLNYFLEMGQQPMNEQERAVMCAFSFPAVILTAGRSKWEVMKPVYMRLAGTFRSPIRRSLACSLHEIARILGPELADRDLALAFADCLVAEDEVKEGVLEHAADFIACLSPKCRSDAIQDLYRAWIILERSSNWRLRHQLVGQLPGLCEFAEGSDLLQVLMPLCIKACADSVSAVREYAVMTFPALWEASERVGLVPEPQAHDATTSGLDITSLDDGEDDQDRTLNDSFSSLHTRQNGELDDVEMGDMNGDFTLAGPPKDLDDSIVMNGTELSAPVMTPCIQAMTTVKDQIIRQTTDFAINGGFRTRVVAVQIVQALLDYGISFEDFEGQFLPLLADRLAVDRVVNTRIWVARVVNWIVDSGYYGDSIIPSSLRELIMTLQLDADRDVRIYAGGPAEPPGSKETQVFKRQRDEETERMNETKKAVLSVFCHDPENGQLTAVEDERGIVIPLDSGVEDQDDSDDDEESDGNSSEESGNEDEEKQDDHIHICQEPPKELSDFIGKGIIFTSEDMDEDMDFETSSEYSESSSMETPDADVVTKETTCSPSSTTDSEFGDSTVDVVSSKGDLIMDETVEQERKEEEQEDDVVDEGEGDTMTENVIPYTSVNASGVSPLDVEVDESPKDGNEDRKEVAANIDESDGLQESDKAISSTTRPVIEHANLNAPSTQAFPPLTSSPKVIQATTTRQPLTPKLSYAASVKYGKDDKAKAQLLASNANSISTMTSFQQINIPEPPSHSSPSSASDSSPAPVRTVTESTALRAMKFAFGFDGKRKPFLGHSSPGSKGVNKDDSNKDEGDVFGEPLSPSFPSLSSSSSASSSAVTSRASTPASSASSSPTSSPPPISYASVVASGAAVAAAAAAAAAAANAASTSRTFSPSINSSTTALTF